MTTDIFQTRPENLASVFQEVLTAVVRLRSNRQTVSDAHTFRSQVKEALALAESEGRKCGYAAEAIRLATFAVVAFVDESVLNQQGATFAEWARKPLQEELFGVHVAGEIFFENVRRLLGQADSNELADLLEVYQLCLLLGYRGRYGSGAQTEIRTVVDGIANKMRRIRGAPRDLSPAWALPKDEQLPSQSDPWGRRLLFTFVGVLTVALLLFVAFRLSLSSGESELRTFAEGRRQ